MINKLNSYVENINAYLSGLFRENEVEQGVSLNKSIKYSLESGGKRLRPVLLLEFRQSAGWSRKSAHLRAALSSSIPIRYT